MSFGLGDVRLSDLYGRSMTYDELSDRAAESSEKGYVGSEEENSQEAVVVDQKWKK